MEDSRAEFDQKWEKRPRVIFRRRQFTKKEAMRDSMATRQLDKFTEMTQRRNSVARQPYEDQELLLYLVNKINAFDSVCRRNGTFLGRIMNQLLHAQTDKIILSGTAIRQMYDTIGSDMCRYVDENADYAAARSTVFELFEKTERMIRLRSGNKYA